MTDKQSKAMEILSRIDELDRLEAKITDAETLERIAERKKVLREALNKL